MPRLVFGFTLLLALPSVGAQEPIPALRQTRNGEVIRPYDASGWTLPYQFGITCIPGSILRALPLDPNELGRTARRYLLGDPPQEFAIYQSAPSYLSLTEGATETQRLDASPILAYPGSDLLLSGYLHGEEALARRWIMACVTRGEGRVLLYSFRPQHRSQTLGTFRLIFNALYR